MADRTERIKFQYSEKFAHEAKLELLEVAATIHTMAQGCALLGDQHRAATLNDLVTKMRKAILSFEVCCRDRVRNIAAVERINIIKHLTDYVSRLEARTEPTLDYREGQWDTSNVEADLETAFGEILLRQKEGR
jgi:hypothetical protein